MIDHLTDGAERLFATHSGKEVVHAAEAGAWPEALRAAVEAVPCPATPAIAAAA